MTNHRRLACSLGSTTPETTAGRNICQPSTPAPAPVGAASSISRTRNAPRLRKDRLLGVEWILMMRGIDAVLALHYDLLRRGRMQPLWPLGSWAELGARRRSSGPDGPGAQATARQVEGQQRRRHLHKPGPGGYRKVRMYYLQFETMEAHILEDWGWNRALAGPLSFVCFGA
ncbi:hypothetical protein CTA2_10416 [Colletotrichum tanaceti]|nr:hypothetical protein CTA2_10416 [Colletotrichum tanaceti]